MGRLFAGILLGYTAWSALWLGAGQGLGTLYEAEWTAFGEGEALTNSVALALLLTASIICSLVAGSLAGKIAGAKRGPAVLTLAGLLLATGIAVQASIWPQMPGWYHLSFLLLLVPVTSYAGRARGPRAAAA